MLSAFSVTTEEARVLGTVAQAPLGGGALRLSPGGRLSHLGPGDEVYGLWGELWSAQSQSELPGEDRGWAPPNQLDQGLWGQGLGTVVLSSSGDFKECTAGQENCHSG